MAIKPQKPQKGQPAIKELYKSVCDIIDYLPSLEVKGDQKSTYVTKSSAGTVIHAAQNNTSNAKAIHYEAGSGLFLSGSVFNVAIDPNTMAIVNNRLSCIVEGGGGPGGPDTTYIGDKNTIPSAHIWVNQSGTSPRLISSDLVMIDNLNNYDFVASPNILMPNSLTACNNTVDVEQVGTIYSNHFIQTRDILHDGVGTKINLCWQRNPFGTPQQGKTAGIVNGLQVDLTLSGGRFTNVKLHKKVYGADDPNTGTRYDPPTESRVDSLLSGDGQHIFIKELTGENEINVNGSWGGIISTNIHGDETTIHMAEDGTLSCIGGSPSPTPGGGGCPWPNYINLGEESNSIVYPLMRYTTSTGGWLRISDKNSSRCNGVWIGDNYVGLGFGADTWTLAIPPGSSFYIDMDFNPTRTKAWFDSTVSPATITIEEFEYWGFPPQWDPNYQTINDLKSAFNEARNFESFCYDCMTASLIQLNRMRDDWAEYEHEYTQSPKSVEWYQERLDEMNNILTGSGYQGAGCDYYLSEATDYAAEVATLNNSLPSTNPMFAYQATDIPVRCQEYYDKIQQYITSGQYYYNLADDYWQAHPDE